LDQVIRAVRKEEIAGRLGYYHSVWDRTCGGRDFMEIGMLPY
jgi:hypothetical protein